MQRKGDLEYFLNLLNDDFQIVENDFFKRDGENFSQLLSNRAILKDIKNSLISKILYNIDVFENFEITYNRVFILGSLDYLRIVLCEENLSDCLKEDLFNVISCYMMYVEKIYAICNGAEELFQDLDLNALEKFFDWIQDYISHDLNIIRRLCDDNFDESLFFSKLDCN